MAETEKRKNPLNQAFGMVLRKARESRSWSYEDVENKSKLKASYIRQVEKGQFNLHVSNCFTLFQTFKTDVTERGIFTLEGLMQLLSIISVLEAKGNEDSDYMEGVKKAAQSLSSSDPRMEKLFENFFLHKVFDTGSNKEAATRIIEAGIDDVVEDFLINSTTFAQSGIAIQKSYPVNFFNDFPTDKIEFLEKIKGVIKKSLPSSYDYMMSWKWEEKNKHLFKNAFILDENPKYLTGYKNLSQYQYDYLWEEEFEEVKILFLSNQDPNHWHDEFRKNLHKSLSNSNDQERLSDFKTAVDKVNIKCIDTEQDSIVARSIINPNNKKYNATWAFLLSNNFNVGVRAVINEDARLTEGEYLKFGETQKMMRNFLSLWNRDEV